MSTAWVAAQLIRVTTMADRPPPRRRVAPTLGLIHEGSTPWILLAILCADPSRLWTAGQLHNAALGMFERRISVKTVSWALVILQRRGMVTTFQDTRNPRYLKYRAITNDTHPRSRHRA